MKNDEAQTKRSNNESGQCPTPSPQLAPVSAISPEPAKEEQDSATLLSVCTKSAPASQSVETDQSDEQQPDRVLHLSRCTGGITKTDLEPWSPTFDELCAQFQAPPDVGEKDGTYFVRGPFREGYPTRADANIDHAELVVLDCDSSINLQTGEITQGAPPPTQVHEILVQLGINHVLYTTYSHGQPGKDNRYRVLMPAAIENKDQLDASVGWTIKQIHQSGCLLADVKENRAWSQPWYFPRVSTADSEFICLIHETGQQLNVRAACIWYQAQQPIAPTQLEAATRNITHRDPNSLFAQFNAKHGNPDWMLQQLQTYGYRLTSESSINDSPSYRLLSPHSNSGSAGTVLFKARDGEWRVFSHHNAEDPLSRQGEEVTASDAWDLYATLEHRGDKQQALADWQRELDARPVIQIVGGQLANNLAAAVKGLAEMDPPSVFQRAQSLVRVAHLEETIETQGVSVPQGTAHIVQLQRAGLAVEASKAIRWEVFKKQAWREADPCPKVIGALLEAVGMWRGIPSLVGVSEAPILRPDGSLLAESGYDERTRLYVEGRNPPVHLPDQISRDDAITAAELLLEPFSEFPFVDEKLDTAVVLAYLFTLPQRAQLPTAPLFCFSATTPGTGKGLLVEACNLLVRGRDAATMPPVQGSGGEDEMRKRLVAVLLEGLSSANIDNCTKAIGGESINALLTATEITDRILGVSKTAKLPNKLTLAATGNNLTVRGDMTRRSLAILLDAGVERPELREFTEKNLPGRILRDRGPLLTALFTILKGYQQAGSPGAQMDLLGRFEAWTGAVCGPIRWLGYPDPLESQHRLREQDPEADKLEVLLSAWHYQFGDQWTSVSDLLETSVEATANYAPNCDPAPGLYNALVEVASDGRGVPNRRKLGWYLRHFTGRIAGGYRLDSKPRTSQRSRNPNQYRVISLDGQENAE
jgi:hypothetical protein